MRDPINDARSSCLLESLRELNMTGNKSTSFTSYGIMYRHYMYYWTVINERRLIKVMEEKISDMEEFTVKKI